MTTKQPSSLAEIKESSDRDFDNAFDLDNYGDSHIVNDKVKQFIRTRIHQSYELGRSVGRAELLREIKNIVPKDRNENLALQKILNKLTLK